MASSSCRNDLYDFVYGNAMRFLRCCDFVCAVLCWPRAGAELFDDGAGDCFAWARLSTTPHAQIDDRRRTGTSGG